jgi:hypothetical protein
MPIETSNSLNLPAEFFQKVYSLMPKPVLIFDGLTLAIIDVNDAALKQIGRASCRERVS